MAWTKEQSNASATNATAFLSNIKAGSLLVVAQNTDQSNATGTPTDTLLNVWNLIETSGATVGGQRVTAWYAIANGAGADTVTCPAGAFNGTSIIELSENTAGATKALDTHNNAQTSGSPFSSPTIAATIAASLMVSWAGSDNGAIGDLTATGSGVIDSQAALSGSASDRIGIQHILSVTGSVTATWSTAAGSFRGDVGIAIFNAVAAGPAADTETRRYQIRRSRMTSW